MSTETVDSPAGTLQAMLGRIAAAEAELDALAAHVAQQAESLKLDRAKAMLAGADVPKEPKALIGDRKRLDELKEHLAPMRDAMHEAVSQEKSKQAARWSGLAKKLEKTAAEQQKAKLRQILPLLRELAVIAGEVRVAAMLANKSLLREAFIRSMADPLNPAPGLADVSSMLISDVQNLQGYGDQMAIDAMASIEEKYAKFEKGN